MRQTRGQASIGAYEGPNILPVLLQNPNAIPAKGHLMGEKGLAGGFILDETENA
jgi:hypothetical protein